MNEENEAEGGAMPRAPREIQPLTKDEMWKLQRCVCMAHGDLALRAVTELQELRTEVRRLRTVETLT